MPNRPSRQLSNQWHRCFMPSCIVTVKGKNGLVCCNLPILFLCSRAPYPVEFWALSLNPSCHPWGSTSHAGVRHASQAQCKRKLFVTCSSWRRVWAQVWEMHSGLV